MKENKNMATLDSIETLLKEFKKNTESHLGVLNGQVGRNTKFRLMSYGAFAVIGFMGITVIIKLFT